MKPQKNVSFACGIISILPYACALTIFLMLLNMWNLITPYSTKILLTAAFVVVVVVPLIYRSSYFIQRSSIFLNYIAVPPQSYLRTPDKCGLDGVCNIYITTKDNMKLGLWLILPDDLIKDGRNRDEEFYKNILYIYRNVIIYCHGNSGNRSAAHRIELYKILRKEFMVVTFDYRGYGDSTNTPPSEIDLVKDCLSVYEWVRNLTVSKVYIWGHSLGAALSTEMVAKYSRKVNPAGLILESTFNNMKDEISTHPLTARFSFLPWFSYTILDPLYSNNLRFATDQHIEKVKCPVMILHAQDDCIVPHKLGVKLFEHAKSLRLPSQGQLLFHSFQKKKGYGHRDIYKAPELTIYIKSFVKRCIRYRDKKWS